MIDQQAKLNPLALWTESMAAWNDLGRSAGEAWMDAFNTMKPGTETGGPEDATRDLFRRLADLNLQHWEHTAKMIEAMPAWMRGPQTLPGSVMTDWFDQVRRSASPEAFMNVFDFTELTGGTPEGAVRRPLGLNGPEGDADDLTRIKGIGPKLSQTLNEIGIYHFRQIAQWQDAEARWVDDFLSFKGRVAREQWIEQAEKCAANGALH
jgi:hypothetical protein